MMRESSEVTYAANVRGPLIASAPRMKSSMLRRSRCDSVFRARPPVLPDRMSAEWRTDDTAAGPPWSRALAQRSWQLALGQRDDASNTLGRRRRPAGARDISGRVLVGRVSDETLSRK